MILDDLDTELRSDAALWREQVDGLRPDFTVAPAATSTRRPHRLTPYVGGLAAAAVVLAATVLVLMLRRDHGSTSTTEAGNPGSSAPASVSTHVPHQARCSDTSGGQSGFGASLAPGATGSRTLAQAVRVAKYGPRKISAWHIAARNAHAVLLLSGPRYLHVIRVSDGTWFVDGGGRCGSGKAILPKP